MQNAGKVMGYWSLVIGHWSITALNVPVFSGGKKYDLMWFLLRSAPYYSSSPSLVVFLFL